MSNAPRNRPRPAAARQPAAAKPRPQSQPFDLDALERDGDPGEYQFTAGGTVFTLADPHDTDWQDTDEINRLAMSNDTRGLMQQLLGEQFDEFAALHVSAWKLNELAENWKAHYGLGEESA